MNTPLRPLFVLALALAAAAPARAASAPTDSSVEEIVVTAPKANQQSVPDNFIGPLAPGQCYASQCPGAMAPTEGALTAMAANDATPSVQKMEDDMLKGGTYSSIDRDAQGNGAVITFPDGSLMYSDYKRGFDTIPKKPEELLADPSFMADNPKARAALLAAAQKGKQKEQDQAQICGSINGGADCQKGDKGDKGAPGFTAADVGGRKSKSTPSPAVTASDTGEKGAAENDQTDWQSVADTIMGRNDGAYGLTGGSNGSDGGTGSSRSDEGFRRESQVTIADINEQVRSGATIDPGSFGFVNTRKAAQAPTLQKLQTGKIFEPAKQDDATAAPQGSRFFGR